ncbi:MAG: hypothetical protein WCC60_18870 [Ilumatobacteraceae bacterium]
MEPLAEETPPFTVPPPPALDATEAEESAVAGQLTAGWSTVFWMGWLLIATSFVAIWYSSRLIGLSTWWLGPDTEPRVILVNLFPLTAPLALAVAGFRAGRWLPFWGMGGAVFVAGIAAFDISDVPGYAAIEFGLAAAGLLLSVASLAGLFRAAK